MVPALDLSPAEADAVTCSDAPSPAAARGDGSLLLVCLLVCTFSSLYTDNLR